MKIAVVALLFFLLRIPVFAGEVESTAKDRALIEAVYRLRIDDVKKLLSDGASVKVRFGDHGAIEAFRDPWDLGWPMVYQKWTALLALSAASDLPPPPRKIENTMADREWALDEAAKIPEQAKKERRKQKLEIAKILISAGADVNIDDGHGATPLYNSAAEPSGVALLLIQHGARVNSKTRTYIDDPGGMTPLHKAVRVPDNVAAIIRAGANLNAVDGSGNTALHLAVLHGEIASVKLLLEAGADRSIKNRKGKRPLDLLEGGISASENEKAVSRLLLDNQQKAGRG
jgi:hypothetical protein